MGFKFNLFKSPPPPPPSKSTIYESAEPIVESNEYNDAKNQIAIENVEMENNEKMWEWLKETSGGKDYVPQVSVDGKLLNEYEEINDLMGLVITEIIGRRIVIK